jgi:hypothetical protein
MAYSQEYQPAMTEPALSRRRVLRFGVLAAAASLAPFPELVHGRRAPGTPQKRRDTPVSSLSVANRDHSTP